MNRVESASQLTTWPICHSYWFKVWCFIAHDDDNNSYFWRSSIVSFYTTCSLVEHAKLHTKNEHRLTYKGAITGLLQVTHNGRGDGLIFGHFLFRWGPPFLSYLAGFCELGFYTQGNIDEKICPICYVVVDVESILITLIMSCFVHEKMDIL